MFEGSPVLRSRCMVVLSLLLISFMGAMVTPQDAIAMTRGAGEGNIAGVVQGGGAGMEVIVTGTNSSSGPLTFTGTTLEDGSFNITVDADPSFISPYNVEVKSSYHYLVGNGLYIFNEENENNTQHVPEGMLTANRIKTSNLTVTVLNGSSMEPLKGATFKVIYGGEVPTPPFDLVQLTDPNGNVSIPDIRSGVTAINISKLNFKYLRESGYPEAIDIRKGGYDNVTIVLREKDWPFKTTPQDRSDDFPIKGNITVDFGAVMKLSTIDTPTAYKLKKVSDGSFIPFTYEVGPEDRSVRIDPQVTLLYNTTYMFWLDSRVQLEIGTKPLWRAMEIFFTTELFPTTVTGYIKEAGTGSPVEGATMTLDELETVTDQEGIFTFFAVSPGYYTAYVRESYLHGAAYGTNLTVTKGETILMDDILVEALPFGSLELNVVSDLGPLENAWVSIEGSPLNLTTNGTGSVMFTRVREGLASLRIGHENHQEIVREQFIFEGSLSYLNVSLVERPFPVTVDATDEISPGVFGIGTNLVLHMPGPIQFPTLDVSLMVMDENERGEEVLINQITRIETSNNYTVDPIPLLSYETTYILVIGEGLKLTGHVESLLWREMEYTFRTPDHINSFIAGNVLLESKTYEGISITYGAFEVMCDDNGDFNLTVDMASADITETLTICGSSLGYNNYSLVISLVEGEVRHLGNITLLPLDGWYSVVPGDGEENVDPETDITFSFMHPVLTPNANASWNTLIGLYVKGTSAPVAGSYAVSGDHLTLIFSPQYDLNEGEAYEVRVSPDLLIFDGRALCPVGNTTEFTVGYSRIRISVIDPLEYDDVALDQPFRLSFGVAVNSTVVEGLLSIDPQPSNVTYQWISGSEVIIKMLLGPEVLYSIVLGPGTYGASGEVLSTNFIFEFTTGNRYVTSHELMDLLYVPAIDVVWTAGNSVDISGTAVGSVGYQVRASLLEGAEVLAEGIGAVQDDGSWKLSLDIPELLEGTYVLNISISSPGGAVAYTLGSSVEIAQPRSASVDEKPSTMVIMVIVAIVAIVILIAVAIFIMRRQKAELEKEGIQYDEVDAEWSGKEE